MVCDFFVGLIMFVVERLMFLKMELGLFVFFMELVVILGMLVGVKVGVLGLNLGFEFEKLKLFDLGEKGVVLILILVGLGVGIGVGMGVGNGVVILNVLGMVCGNFVLKIGVVNEEFEKVNLLFGVNEFVGLNLNFGVLILSFEKEDLLLWFMCGW